MAGMKLDGNKITADGTYDIPTIPGASYAFSVSGAFMGGSLIVRWVNAAGEATAFEESPVTAPGAFTITAPSNLVQLVLSGATSPSITVGMALVARSSASSSITPADIGAVATTMLSPTGGPSKVPQIDSVGSLSIGTHTGNPNGDGDIYDPAGPGNFWLQNRKFFGWRKADGTKGPGAYYDQVHDSFGGELIWDIPWRMAIIQNGPLQFGNNASVRDAQCLVMVSGAATAGDQLRESKPIVLQSITWNGGAPVVKHMGFQSVPLTEDGSNMVLRFFSDAAVTGSNGGYSIDNGKLTGTLMTEMSSMGIWTPGTSPAFDTLTDAPTVTLTCSKYKTIQTSKVTLTDDRELNIVGEMAGMRGVIYVRQGAGAPHTLTLPTNSAKASTFALSNTLGEIDRLSWEFDGTYFYWTINNAIEIPTDADAAIFLDAGRANISDAAQRSAINDLVIALKSSNVAGTGTLWSKFIALYPYVGGTSTSHAKNLKSTNYDITWVNDAPGRHTSNGVTGDVASSFHGNTGLNANVLNQNSLYLYGYCKTQTPASSGGWLYGTTNGVTSRVGGIVNSTGGSFDVSANTTGESGAPLGGADWRKHFAINRSSSGSFDAIINATKSSFAVASVVPAALPLYVFSRGAANYSPVNQGFNAFGEALTDAEQTAFRSIIDAFQTALGRANP